jgi:hypothetical protein
MATVVNQSTVLVDSGIGPVAVTQAILDNFDLDDFIHSITISQCIQLQLVNAIQAADQTLAEGRPPLSINGNIIGGY